MNGELLKRLFFCCLIFAFQFECYAQFSVHRSVDSLFAECNSKTPGYAVAIIKDGKIDYLRGYGMANLEYDIPITTTTPFHLASVSKQFTAYCIHLLAKEGKLSLDDSIQKHLPGFPHYKHTITIRNLLQHTSGIRDQWELLGLSGAAEPDLITQENVLDVIYRQRGLNFSPGDKWLYSNSGYTLLAEIVSRVSGQLFSEFVKQHIFQPLEMNSSFINDDAKKIIKSKAYSYEDAGENKFSKTELNYSTYGATSMFSTAEDLVKWLINFSTLQIGSKDIFEQMQQRAVLNSGDTVFYGSGLFVDTYKNLKRIFHDGTDAGFQTFVGYFPVKKFGVIVLSNWSSAEPAFKAMAIADLYLQLPASLNASEKNSSVSYQFMPINKNNLSAYSGNYETEGGNVIKIFYKDTSLMIKLPGIEDPDTLEPINDTVFHVFGNMWLTFKKMGSSKYNEISFKTFNWSNKADRVEYVSYSPSQLQQFTGTYYSEELQTVYELIVLNNQLIMRHIRNGDIPLMPKTQDRFATTKWYANKILFQRDDKGNVVFFAVSSGRMINVRFEKVKW